MMSGKKFAEEMAEHGLGIYVLTIDELNGKRRRHASTQLALIANAFEFVEGYLKSDARLNDYYDSKRNLIFANRIMSDGEKAVYAGHRKIFSQFLKSPARFALVFEDDFQFVDVDQFCVDVRNCLAHADAWDMIKFFDFKPKKVKETARFGTTEIVRYKYPPSGAVAYLIGRKTAEKFLSRKRFFRPIDEDFSWEWELDIKIWSVNTILIKEVSPDIGGSLLEEDRLEAKRSRKTFRRIWANFLSLYKNIRSKFR